jgi:hypothetical protein
MFVKTLIALAVIAFGAVATIPHVASAAQKLRQAPPRASGLTTLSGGLLITKQQAKRDRLHKRPGFRTERSRQTTITQDM